MHRPSQFVTASVVTVNPLTVIVSGVHSTEGSNGVFL
jgi:hypothetical protein